MDRSDAFKDGKMRMNPECIDLRCLCRQFKMLCKMTIRVFLSNSNQK